ncbi:hypothetical protein BV22DRAFT_1010643 [Leucogyrophana mollusca]|uniref:Uncharacterized protein n=1 Tax=Leucogyrophana mollusca TaxID=85980 RepID=A0ACB8BK87_9AGAM|nr:hypothetical protein BV22DRAFT_1010643 [Leucogyrophana mollusca]
MSSISFLRNESSQSPLRSVTAADVPSDKLHSPLNVSSDIIGKDELQRKALAFSRKGVLVKDIFDRWRERTAARIKWIEACRRSDSYSQKVQTQRRLPSNTGNITPERKRKTGPVDTRTPVRKRLKNRLSTEYKPPRNDEELAKRFEQNHEEHERRWARGSFLRALKDHLATLGGHSRPSNWSAWLSLNQENDGTAIWLEQKWDIPNSGKWRNDNIFEIPILEIHENSGVFPGIIIFERTPLSGVDDQLERKYRILDDCARLREIIDALPRSRHYLPSLLTVSWIKGGSDTTADFSDMVDTFLQDGTLNAHQEFLLTSTTTDLDIKVSEILQHLSLDVEGTLVQQMTFGALFKTIEPQLNFAVRWLDSCVINGEFDWYCHAKLLELTVAFLNGGIHTLFNLLDDPQPSDCLPPLDLQSATDSKVTFQLVLDWLQHPSICKATRGLVNDVQSHQILGREFPSRSFIPHLYNVVEDLAGLSMKRDGAALFCIQKSRFQEFSVQVAEMSSAVQDELKALHASRVRRSPKRRSSFGTSVSSRSSTPAKRRRLSVSNGSPPSREGSPAPSTAVPNHPSPSLSATTSLPSEDKFTLVTPAMLRALTKDVKAKYGSPLAAGSS